MNFSEKVKVNNIKEIREKDLFNKMLSIILLDDLEINYFKPYYDKNKICFEFFDLNNELCINIEKEYPIDVDKYEIFENIFNKTKQLFKDVNNFLNEPKKEINKDIIWSEGYDDIIERNYYYQEVYENLYYNLNDENDTYTIIFKNNEEQKYTIFIACNLETEEIAQSLLLYINDRKEELNNF